MKPVAELDKICDELAKLGELNEHEITRGIKQVDYLESKHLSYVELQYIMFRLQMMKEEELVKLSEIQGSVLVDRAKRILNPSSSSVRSI